MMYKCLVVFVFLFVNVFSKVWAGHIVELKDSEGAEFYRIAKGIQYHEDKDHSLSLNDVTSKEYADIWQTYHDKTFQFIKSSSTYWVKFDISNVSSEADSWILEFEWPLVDEATVFVGRQLESDDSFVLHKTLLSGTTVNPAERYLESRRALFNLSIPKGKTISIVLKLRTDKNALYPMRLWKEKTFLKYDINLR